MGTQNDPKWGPKNQPKWGPKIDPKWGPKIDQNRDPKSTFTHPKRRPVNVSTFELDVGAIRIFDSFFITK